MSEENVMSPPASPVIAPDQPFWVRHLRREFQFLLDLGVLALAFALAYLLRFDFSLPPTELRHALTQLPFVVLLQFAALMLTGVYAFIWRYVGMAEIMAFVRAGLFSLAPVLVLRLALPAAYQAWRVPISVAIMDTVLAFGGVLALRVVRRGVYERFERNGGSGRRERKGQRALFVGAGRAGLLAARELASQSASDLKVIGFVDDDPQKLGSVIHGVKVLGRTDQLAELVREHQVEQVVITLVKAPRETIRRLVETCRRVGVEARIMPALYEILEGRVSVSRFRAVRIDDLLGREAVQLEAETVEGLVAGRVVLVTGAGGSIGAELARQVARFSPRGLVLVDRSEVGLFELHRELATLWPTLSLHPVTADVGDARRIRQVLAEHRPSVILHAAAHKHVPLMEANPGDAVANNTLATRRLGELAGQAGVERFVLVSTDKAVNPTSVMGASKRLAELLVQDLQPRFATRYLAVRFGNVLDSAGSVVPIFREQIERGGPVTVTHPEMQRYFMTIPEAAQLVLQAAAMGEGGEIFVLDMGAPVKIVDLARDMIRLAGLEPETDVEIVFTGQRPGEKLFEELEYEDEALSRTAHPKILIGRLQTYSAEAIAEAIAQLEASLELADPVQVRSLLQRWVPEARMAVSDRPAARDEDAPKLVAHDPGRR